ncbi:hypothetical protein D3C87_932240 [compost metagenome]
MGRARVFVEALARLVDALGAVVNLADDAARDHIGIDERRPGMPVRVRSAARRVVHLHGDQRLARQVRNGARKVRCDGLASAVRHRAAGKHHAGRRQERCQHPGENNFHLNLHVQGRSRSGHRVGWARCLAGGVRAIGVLRTQQHTPRTGGCQATIGCRPCGDAGRQYCNGAKGAHPTKLPHDRLQFITTTNIVGDNDSRFAVSLQAADGLA